MSEKVLSEIHIQRRHAPTWRHANTQQRRRHYSPWQHHVQNYSHNMHKYSHILTYIGSEGFPPDIHTTKMKFPQAKRTKIKHNLTIEITRVYSK
jgi:hypothetical protein